MHVILVVAITGRRSEFELTRQVFVPCNHSDDSADEIQHGVFFVHLIKEMLKPVPCLAWVGNIKAPLADVPIRYFVHGKFALQSSQERNVVGQTGVDIYGSY
jgi:hypothetical protein